MSVASVNAHVWLLRWTHVVLSAITVTSGWWCVLKITYYSCAGSLPACFLLPFTLQLT